MSAYVYIGGAWKQAKELHINTSSGFKKAKKIYVWNSGNWLHLWSAYVWRTYIDSNSNNNGHYGFNVTDDNWGSKTTWGWSLGDGPALNPKKFYFQGSVNGGAGGSVTMKLYGKKRGDEPYVQVGDLWRSLSSTGWNWPQGEATLYNIESGAEYTSFYLYISGPNNAMNINGYFTDYDMQVEE